MYYNINDFELLYLINEGNDKALEYLFFKYKHLIVKMARRNCLDSDKYEDLVQEGFMILHCCVRNYNTGLHVTFYTYFCLSFIRRINRLKNNCDYYNSNILLNLNENWTQYKPENKRYHNFIAKDIHEKFKDDEVSLNIYFECICYSLSLKGFSRKYQLDYRYVLKKHKIVVEYLKEIIVNYL
ncbi:MAG: hypothetical protein K6E20_03565 [Acholeplasmatales bacterium]|nr:hypothetical protein [Acholeplasmatales bacterium]